DAVVSSPTVRRDAVQRPTVKAALEHSTPVAVFGAGEDRIEIRRTDRAATIPAAISSRAPGNRVLSPIRPGISSAASLAMTGD
ncbi:hypothetical protein ACFWMG_43370, partial [Streptomyces sp. NPDC127074]|uniref:hypothetical protein n=1 Tax=Streptomyces sp. NPDC127074 TaxID=3347130 RepID=UPI00364D5B15